MKVALAPTVAAGSFDLILGSVWDEIRDICRSALTCEEIGGRERLIELTRQGSELMIELLEHEKKQQEWERQQENTNPDNDEGDDGDEILEIEEFYPYRDPFYVSPFWVMPLFFL